MTRSVDTTRQSSSTSRPPTPPSREVRQTRQHAFELPVAPATAFPLFTPLGERDWVPGWDPVPIHPADGTAEAGMVFLTRAPGEADTIWWMEPASRTVWCGTCGSRPARAWRSSR